MRLLAVILHYGEPALSRELCRVLREADPARAHDVRVLDNAAPLPYDGAWRREPENRFWAGALDLCMGLARSEGFSHLWFLNNDIRFLAPPALTGVEARLARLELALGAPIGLWSPAITVNPYHPQMCPKKGAPSHAVRQVRLLDGVAPVFNLEAVADGCTLDAADNPRGYGVDLWLSLRVAAAGKPVLVDQSVIIRHRAHSTARTVPGFLSQAAQDEDRFCTARLGPNWRERLEAMKLEDAHSAQIFTHPLSP